ncbi:MAG: diguanylate cyclase [Acidobacteria bacterium]|nr:diguanylate cyclase [Acidobacteriota bacterium]
MNLLAITRHAALVERLRMAFEGAGHQVFQVQDPLQALATEAWNQAQILLVDAAGDPVDGYRLCKLLRGEIRPQFHNLGIFMILESPPTEDDLDRLKAVDADGFVSHEQSLQQILGLLGPAMGGELQKSQGPPVLVHATGLPSALFRRIQELLGHFRFDLKRVPARNLPEVLEEDGASILLMGTDPDGSRTLARLQTLRSRTELPYLILIGALPDEASQRKLFLGGVADWLPLPLSAPRMLHACRRAVEWHQAQRIKREFERQIGELRERRALLEMEAAALRNEVLTDPMTGILNRRSFDQNLDHAFRQWERHRRSFVLILGDVDHFKLVNDRFGHLVGDQVLRGLAQRLRTSLRRSDLAFRIGGEEFAVILPETSLRAGHDVAEKLRRKIDQEPITLDSGRKIFPTMSFGVGSVRGASPMEFFAQVDQSLYRAKKGGRNTVEVLEEAEAK